MRGLQFKSDSGCEYFYDDRTGFIHSMYSEDEKVEYGEKYREIINLCDYQEKEEVTIDKVKEHLYNEAYGFRQLIFETASGCNLRCKYCIYSDHYPTYKTYENKMLNIETAMKAVDYYMDNFLKIQELNPTRKANIGFYGGEPLLSYNVIKEVVVYANMKYGDILYHITTNGILLTEEVQDYLVKNDFSIIVSLDGNKKDHDRNRVTLEGNGSFDIVINNIRTLRKRYPDYGKIGISLCYDFKSDIKEIEKFIEDEELFVTKMSMIDSHNTSYYDQFTYEDINSFLNNKKSYEEKFKEVCKDKTINKGSFLYTYIGVDYSEFAFHSVYRESKPSIIPCSGTCVPGEKLYVTTDGMIHICEKINSNYPIGDVDHGLNYEKIVDIIKSYRKLFEPRCVKCDIKRFCNICFAQCSSEEGFKKAMDECNSLKESIKHKLGKYVSLLEVNPGVFDDITVDYYNQIMERVGGCFEL